MSDSHGHGEKKGGILASIFGSGEKKEDAKKKEKQRTLLEKYGFEEPERDETEYHAFNQLTGYPNPMGNMKYHVVYETAQQYIEEHYYWILHNMRYDFGFTHFDKVTDIFAASEQSAFFGVSEQRLAAQQDRISTFLRGISEMLKSLFQLVREIRIVDERLTFYNDSYIRGEGASGSEITLKGIWVDQVEGGVKNAGSVYGLAQTVGFTILPDLFFRLKINDKGLNAHVGDWETYQQKTQNYPQQIDEIVSKLDFNEKVKEVLKRKLTQYYIWKTRTYKELNLRKRFTVKYLRQHYDTIRLYMGWIKPYLRNVKKLRMDQNKMDSFELVSAFEGSMVEIEVLLSRQTPDTKLHPCVLLTFFFRTRPALGYVGEGYQRGPTHVGKMDLTMRGYVWSVQQVQNYKNMRMEEDFELLSTIDESIKEALDALGDELKSYLMSESEKMPELPKESSHKEHKIPGILEPFSAVFEGFKSMGGAFGSIKDLFPEKGKEEVQDIPAEEYVYQKSLAKSWTKRALWLTWKNFKKHNDMPQW